VSNQKFVANVRAMYEQYTMWPDGDWLDEFCGEVWRAACMEAEPLPEIARGRPYLPGVYHVTIGEDGSATVCALPPPPADD
jgi:hypothetical protein